MRPPVTGPAAEEMRQFFGRYGAFLQLWQTYELMLEVLIMRALRLSPIETSILCGSLNYSAKSNMLFALLKLKNAHPTAVAALREAQAIADRNDFVHSFLTHAEGIVSMHLVRRDVKGGKYKVDIREVNTAKMQKHGDEFQSAFQKAADLNRVRDEDVDAYVLEIESHAQGFLGAQRDT